jgi:hypothetical protein
MTVNTETMDVVGNGIGIEFDPGPEEWTINPGILVASTGTFGVRSIKTGSNLDNFGDVYSTTTDAVVFNGTSGSIENELGATISGSTDGIYTDGDGLIVKNTGSVIGLSADGILLFVNSRSVQILNQGLVAGGSNGIDFHSDADGGTLTNTGIVWGYAGDGVHVNTDPGLVTDITNGKGGSIVGAIAAVQVDAGNLDLVNRGSLDGAVDCANASSTDTIINNGAIHGSVVLDGAVDSFNGKKGTSGAIYTGGGSDTVQLGKGAVFVHIDDSGSSMLTAGTGHDKFIFDNGAGGGHVVIKSFSATLDRIVVSESLFPNLGAVGNLHANHFGINGNAHNHLGQIVYNTSTGYLYYDANGDLPGGATHFATLASHPPVTAGTFLVEA